MGLRATGPAGRRDPTPHSGRMRPGMGLIEQMKMFVAKRDYDQRQSLEYDLSLSSVGILGLGHDEEEDPAAVGGEALCWLRYVATFRA